MNLESEVLCQFGSPFTLLPLELFALHRLRCAGLIHVVRMVSQSRCIDEGRPELGLSRGATADVVDFQSTEQIDG